MTMRWQANAALLVTAGIWGLAFVAQRVGMEYLEPFTFNGIRFLLGALSLLPLLWWQQHRKTVVEKRTASFRVFGIGVIAGLILFLAASLQQIGIVDTTAGKAAFVTSLYIVLVPLSGVLLGQRVEVSLWLGCLLSLLGLYFLCIREDFTLSFGDFLVLVGAVFWTMHILWIDRFASQVQVLSLAVWQFTTCAILSLLVAVFTETITLAGIRGALSPILYGGIGSVGIAYTLQIVGQKRAEPTQASLILSLETVFAAIGGYFLLHEFLTSWELLGCVLMMIGILVAQIPWLAWQNGFKSAWGVKKAEIK
ncbi:DMT family transporter [Anaeroarcus burkinensis]|uniref:DMT family transporter n=1 Tax=Anaeroarcus burkinensis TaxID=82376 RepID=UPI000422CA0E|nr:DMT family transporter [Anaeroarcus burkinensis]